MTVKPKKQAKRPKVKTTTSRKSAEINAGLGRWRMSELPAEQQVELRQRLDEARRGRNLIPFDQAMDDAESMADEVVDILNRSDSRRPTE